MGRADNETTGSADAGWRTEIGRRWAEGEGRRGRTLGRERGAAGVGRSRPSRGERGVFFFFFSFPISLPLHGLCTWVIEMLMRLGLKGVLRS